MLHACTYLKTNLRTWKKRTYIRSRYAYFFLGNYLFSFLYTITRTHHFFGGLREIKQQLREVKRERERREERANWVEWRNGMQAISMRERREAVGGKHEKRVSNATINKKNRQKLGR